MPGGETTLNASGSFLWQTMSTNFTALFQLHPSFLHRTIPFSQGFLSVEYYLLSK